MGYTAGGINMVNEPSIQRVRSALIVWDMQVSTLERIQNAGQVIENTRLVLNAARIAKLPIIYTQTTGLPYEYLSFYSLYQNSRVGTDPRKIFKPEGSPGWQITNELVPLKEEMIIKKHTGSLFVGTSAELLLQNRKIDAIILAGVVTEGGIENTARHASTLGYLPLIVEDAVGSSNIELHSNSLRFLREKFEVRTARNTVESIQNGSFFI
jgi:nicotinamidase-related amidase